MSTLCAFFGLDDKRSGDSRHASAYLASESRITKDGEIESDCSQKLFTAAAVPAIFGYVGDRACEDVLSELADECGVAPMWWGSGPEACAALVVEFLRKRLPSFRGLNHGAKVVCIGRSEEEDGMQFHIWEYVRPRRGDWRSGRLMVPKVSGPPLISTKRGIRQKLAWGNGASRYSEVAPLRPFDKLVGPYFRSLLRSVREKPHPTCGGPAQVVMLGRGLLASYIGVIESGQKFVCGRPYSIPAPRVSRWIDENFDECDPNTSLRRLDRKLNPPTD